MKPKILIVEDEPAIADNIQYVLESEGLDTIHATLDHHLSNGLVESTNTKIRVITRVAFGFKDPAALIALAMLSLGGYRPNLPGRP